MFGFSWYQSTQVTEQLEQQQKTKVEQQKKIMEEAAFAAMQDTLAKEQNAEISADVVPAQSEAVEVTVRSCLCLIMMHS